MKHNVFKKIVLSAAFLLSQGYLHSASAHVVGGFFDFSGNNASAVDLVAVTCFDDGNGPADHLTVQIEDRAAFVSGLLVSIQVYKDNKMTNTTAGSDGRISPPAILRAGGGEYRISVTKTAPGTRNINVTYHCETAGNGHTGTSELSIFQVQ